MKFNSGEVGRIKRSAFAEDVNARSLVYYRPENE